MSVDGAILCARALVESWSNLKAQALCIRSVSLVREEGGVTYRGNVKCWKEVNRTCARESSIAPRTDCLM